MAIVKVEFDGGNVPVVTGQEPPKPEVPIQDPVDVPANANEFFFARPGFHTYALKTDIAHTPLWQTVQAIDGVPQTIKFARVP